VSLRNVLSCSAEPIYEFTDASYVGQRKTLRNILRT